MAVNLYDANGVGVLDPDDFNAFQTRRRGARTAYDLGTAQNQYKRDTYAQQYGRQSNDLRIEYGRKRRDFGSDLNKRGLLNSGLYDSAYRDLQTDKLRSGDGLRGQYDNARRGLDLADSQLGIIKNSSLNDVESAEAARRSSVAAALKYAQENG